MDALTPRDFEFFYTAEFDRVVRAVYVIVGRREEAWDITQEAFARTWAHWDRLRRRDAPVVYVLAAARNLSNSHVRRLIRQRRLHARLIAETRDETTELASGSMLEAAVAGLSSRQRWAVVLCDFLDLSSDSAAHIMGIAPSTVRVHLARARSRLKEELTDGPPIEAQASIDPTPKESPATGKGVS